MPSAPFLAMITPLGSGAYPGHDLPLFPSHPIVVPPGGAYPPYYPPRPGHDLPLFPTHLPVVPPGGAWPPYAPPYPDHSLPPFATHLPVVPPGGAYPPWSPPTPGHDLPLFPFHPIVVPPGGVWPSPIPPPQGPGAKPPITPIPPGEVGNHPSTGVLNVYVWVPYVGVVGPIFVPLPGAGQPATPPAVP
jgi:hypothetical protein